MNADLLTQWLDARDLADRLGNDAKKAKADAATLEAELLKEFERDGVNSVKIHGVTVYLHRDLRARVNADDKDALIGALVGTEWEWLVQPVINAQTLTAWVREQDRDGRELPAVLADHGVQVAELFSVRARGR